MCVKSSAFRVLSQTATANAFPKTISREATAPKSKPIAIYDYTDENGKLLYQISRYEPKRFGHRQPDGHGGWIYKGTQKRVLYRLPELIAFRDATVFICEGEKGADNVAALGLCATTVASGKWTDDCVQALAGRDCWIFEDNDDTGRKKALEAAKLLHPVANSVKIIRLPSLAEGEDISDWLDASHTRQDLEDVCYSTPDWEPGSAPSASILRPGPPTPPRSEVSSSSKAEDKPKQATILNYRRHRDAINSAPKYLVKNLLPESGVGLLSGQSGTYKSFVAIKLAGAVGMGQPFAGHPIRRQGAVLIFATEGAGELPFRLDAVSKAEHDDHKLPLRRRGAASGQRWRGQRDRYG
jgi:AAA domain-containing protein